MHAHKKRWTSGQNPALGSTCRSLQSPFGRLKLLLLGPTWDSLGFISLRSVALPRWTLTFLGGFLEMNFWAPAALRKGWDTSWETYPVWESPQLSVRVKGPSLLWMKLSPQNSYVASLTPIWLYLQMRSLEVWLDLDEVMRVGLWSYRISVFIRRDTRESACSFCMNTRKGHVKKQEGDGHLQAKERGLRRNPPYWHFDLGLSAPKTMRK